MYALKFIRCLLRDNGAATAIEYGLILALVCLAMMAALRAVADDTTDIWAYVKNNVVEASGA
jgi:pilus assembly protein Flp/PilA